MEYTPGRVYRHKRRMGKKYRAPAQPRNFEPLATVVSLAAMIAFVAMFAAWWLI